MTTPTKAVIENSKGDLSESAQKIFDICVNALNELNMRRPLPTDQDVEKRLAVLVP
ncbi:hypothetical protein LJR231_001357 [Phyllobacterium sp. LjRoot231]|uniref:hypothetical protein n=1 Tax=Phyllobacterium sp. LjRoot231 TaxID=3342289 RepID=UPI003ED05469